jgi:hypothetical protein
MSTKKQRNAHNNDVFKIWNVLPIETVFEQIILTKKYFDFDFTAIRQHQYTTRLALSNPLPQPMSVNKYHECTWNFILPRLWNKLPKELKILTSKKNAKEKIKSWYLSLLT